MQVVNLKNALEEDLFTLLGLEGLEENQKEEILLMAQNTVLARVYDRIRGLLEPFEQELLDSLTEGELQALLAEKGLDLQAITIEEAVRYRFEIIAAFEASAGFSINKDG